MLHNSKSKSLCVIQYDEYALQMLKVVPSHSGIDVEDCVIEKGNWSTTDGSLSRALIHFSEQHDLAQHRVYAVFPRHEVAVRIVELPTQDEDEVSGMVNLMAGEMLPLPQEELVVSSCILDSLSDGQSRVLVAVARLEAVQEYLDLLRIAGIEPDQLLLSVRCLLAAAQYPHPIHEPDVMMVECGSNSVECVGFQGGQFVYSRSAVWNESSPDALTEKLDKLITAFRREALSMSDDFNVYISSPIESADTLVDLIGARLKLSCSPAAPIMRGVRNGVDALHDTIPASLLGGVLLAQKDVTPTLNLMPSRVLAERHRATTQNRAVRLGLSMALVLILSVVLYLQAVGDRKNYIETLESQAEVLRPHAKAIITKRNHLELLKDRVEHKDTVYEHFGRIVSQVPDKAINISRFTYRIDEGITLQGRADRPERFDSFIDNLRTLGRTVYPQLAQAQEMYRTLRKERGKDVWDYSISIPFPEGGEE